MNSEFVTTVNKQHTLLCLKVGWEMWKSELGCQEWLLLLSDCLLSGRLNSIWNSLRCNCAGDKLLSSGWCGFWIWDELIALQPFVLLSGVWCDVFITAKRSPCCIVRPQELRNDAGVFLLLSCYSACLLCFWCCESSTHPLPICSNPHWIPIYLSKWNQMKACCVPGAQSWCFYSGFM